MSGHYHYLWMKVLWQFNIVEEARRDNPVDCFYPAGIEGIQGLLKVLCA